ncbi:hypothetical protein ScalyP_jg4694 [Parmales sp. scaly parma]|nr:hypothetical protein ScalyP_jg4694 [Parmales sp. scaly parma]
MKLILRICILLMAFSAPVVEAQKGKEKGKGKGKGGGKCPQFSDEDLKALEAAAGANSNAAKTIAGSVSLQKFSYKNIKLAIEFFQMGGSCPALPETGGANGGCKTINPNPSVAACVPYNAGKHYATIKAAKEANVAKEEVAKNKLNFVPWNKVIGAYDSIV